MVNIQMDGQHAQIGFTGDPVQVGMKLATAISGIYQGLYSKNRLDAAIFKGAVMGLMDENSPVWNREHDMTVVTVPIKKKSDAPTDQS